MRLVDEVTNNDFHIYKLITFISIINYLYILCFLLREGASGGLQKAPGASPSASRRPQGPPPIDF